MTFSNNYSPFKDVHYERRIVFFLDILGWRNAIDQAGDDPQRVALLAARLRLLSGEVISKIKCANRIYISLFSDNVVISMPYEQDSLCLRLEALASILVGATCMGFFFRGGVTIGNLYHNRDIVFGPALNRAYDLERKEANYPLVLLDPEISELTSIRSDCIYKEKGKIFLDPFTHSFIAQRMRSNPDPQILMAAWAEETGMKESSYESGITSEIMLQNIFLIIQQAMETTLTPCVKEKYMWLYTRINNRLKNIS